MPLAAEYAAMFEQLGQQDPAPPLWELSTAQAREMYRAMRPLIPELPVHNVVDRTIPGSETDIPVRIYTPSGDGPFGVLMYFHGGGWVIGDLDTCDAPCREICHLANLVVASVDYRLAPEALFPAAAVDCYEATTWVAANMGELNGNGKIGVTGESAGGNLSTAVALRARDEQGPEIAFQCLLYPVTDCDLTRGSYSENGTGYLLELQTLVWFWDTYCPDAADRESPLASPIKSENLSNLPPALVITAEFDPLRDEGEAYAAALEAAGNQVTARRYDGLVHDFFATAPVFECSRTAFLETLEAYKTHLN